MDDLPFSDLRKGLLYTLSTGYARHSHPTIGASFQKTTLRRKLPSLEESLDVRPLHDVEWFTIDWSAIGTKIATFNTTKTVLMYLSQVLVAYGQVWRDVFPGSWRQLRPFATYLCASSYPTTWTDMLDLMVDGGAPRLKHTLQQLGRLWNQQPRLRRAVVRAFELSLDGVVASAATVRGMRDQKLIAPDSDVTVLHAPRLLRAIESGTYDHGWTLVPLPRELPGRESTILSEAQEWLMLKTGERDGVRHVGNYTVMHLPTMARDALQHHERTFYAPWPSAEVTNADEFLAAKTPSIKAAILEHVPEVGSDTRARLAKADPALQPLVQRPEEYLVANHARFLSVANPKSGRVRPRFAKPKGPQGPRKARALFLSVPPESLYLVKEGHERLACCLRGKDVLWNTQAVPMLNEPALLQHARVHVHYEGVLYVPADTLRIYAQRMNYPRLLDLCSLMDRLTAVHRLYDREHWQALYTAQQREAARAAGKSVRGVPPFTAAEDQFLYEHWRPYLRDHSGVVAALPRHTLKQIKLRARVLMWLRERKLPLDAIRDEAMVKAVLGRTYPHYKHVLVHG